MRAWSKREEHAKFGKTLKISLKHSKAKLRFFRIPKTYSRKEFKKN